MRQRRKMASQSTRSNEFSAEGQVVEILGRADALRAKVLLDRGTVLGLAVGNNADVHLGDVVEIEGTVIVRSLRARVDAVERSEVRDGR